MLQRSRSMAHASVDMSWQSFGHKSSQPIVLVVKSLYKWKSATGLCVRLLDSGAFHYKVWPFCFDQISFHLILLQNTNTHTGFCQNKILSEILYLVWFEDKMSQGLLLQHYFNPIPFETLALILTESLCWTCNMFDISSALCKHVLLRAE